jgi:hypothetical protein
LRCNGCLSRRYTFDVIVGGQKVDSFTERYSRAAERYRELVACGLLSGFFRAWHSSFFPPFLTAFILDTCVPHLANLLRRQPPLLRDGFAAVGSDRRVSAPRRTAPLEFPPAHHTKSVTTELVSARGKALASYNQRLLSEADAELFAVVGNPKLAKLFHDAAAGGVGSDTHTNEADAKADTTSETQRAPSAGAADGDRATAQLSPPASSEISGCGGGGDDDIRGVHDSVAMGASVVMGMCGFFGALSRGVHSRCPVPVIGCDEVSPLVSALGWILAVLAGAVVACACLRLGKLERPEGLLSKIKTL